MPGSTSCSARACSTTRCSRSASSDEPLVWLVDRHRDHHRHRLFLSAVHGAAALRQPGEDGRDAARGRRRSRLPGAGRRSGWSPCRCRRPGILAGALLCFIPIVGEFVIPDLLGGSHALMIGQTLWTEFFQNKDWPAASAVAIALLADPAGADPDLSAHAGARAGGPLMRKGRRSSTSPRSRSASPSSICRSRSW